MPEKLICPKCLSESNFRHGLLELKCSWCWYQYTTADRLSALKKLTKKPFKKMAVEVGMNSEHFRGFSSGRYEPNFSDMDKVLSYMKKEYIKLKL